MDPVVIVGRGGFGEVRLGRYDNREVAVKIIESGEESWGEKDRSYVENEVLLMSHCHHHSILQLYGYCYPDPRTVYLVMELCSEGSLWSRLQNTTSFPEIPLSLSISWLCDIISALKYLHQHKIIHRDVKAENVLLASGLYCKLSDFGLAKQHLSESLGSNHSRVGSLDFMSPEVKNGDKATH